MLESSAVQDNDCHGVDGMQRPAVGAVQDDCHGVDGMQRPAAGAPLISDTPYT